MDPLSITSSILALIDAGLKIKASIDKIGRNHQRLHDLSADILEDLYTMNSFCDLHKLDLKNAPELEASLVKLHSILLDVASKCERTINGKTTNKIGKIVQGFKSWKNADVIQAEVSRLRELVQACMNRIQLYVSARSELTVARSQLAIARVEHNILVLQSKMRANIHRLDAAFGASMCGRTSADFAPLLQNRASDLDIEYLHLKLQHIADALETVKFSSVDISSFRDVNYSLYVSRLSTNIVFLFESSLLPTWRVIHSLQSDTEIPFSRSYMDLAIKLAWDSTQYGITQSIRRILAILTRAFREVVNTNDDESLLFYFSWVISRECRCCPPSQKRQSLSQEMVDVLRRLYESPRQTYPKSHSLIWLQQSIRSLAWDYHHNDDDDAAISHFREGLEITNSFDGEIQHIPITYEILGTYFNSSPPRTLVQDYPVAQNTASFLNGYATVLQSCGRYSEAYCAGRDSLTVFNALRNKANDLPQDFDFQDNVVTWLRTNLPSWVEIVRNPTVLEEFNEEEDDMVSQSGDNIEWGIAM